MRRLQTPAMIKLTGIAGLLPARMRPVLGVILGCLVAAQQALIVPTWAHAAISAIVALAAAEGIKPSSTARSGVTELAGQLGVTPPPDGTAKGVSA